MMAYIKRAKRPDELPLITLDFKKQLVKRQFNKKYASFRV